MASLVSHRLAHEGFPVRAVYTYGSPRPGDRHFRDAYRLPNYRFVNDNDLVPHLPLRWCYRHVGLLKLLTRDGKLLEQQSHWKSKKRELVKHAKHVQRAHRTDADPHLKLGEFDWLADHHLDGYLAGIARLLPRRAAATASGIRRHRAGRRTLALHRRARRTDRPPAKDDRRAASSPPGQSRKASWRPRSSSSRSGGNRPPPFSHCRLWTAEAGHQYPRRRISKRAELRLMKNRLF